MKLTKILIFLGSLAIVAVEFIRPVTAINQDLGRHLLLGKIIISTYHVPFTNLFSYTYPNFPFLNTHWLSEVIFYYIQHNFGFNGLLLFTFSIIALAFTFIFLTNAKKVSSFSISIVSLSYLAILFDRTDVRPEIFSFLFFSIFITILLRNDAKPTRLLFILPFIELLWVNMHIYFIFGPLLILFFLAASIFYYAREVKNNLINLLQKHSSLFFILIFTTVATLINPHGLQGALYPFFVFNNYAYPVRENLSIFTIQSLYFNFSILFFEACSIMLFTLLLYYRRKTKAIDWLLTISFVLIGAAAIRNMPLFLFGTFGIFAQLIDFLGSSIKKIYFVEKHRKTLMSSLTVLLIFFAIWEIGLFTSIKPIGLGSDETARNAVTFFQKNNIKGPILNNFDIGSYLIYMLYPTEKVFVDGRPEAYPASFFQNVYIPMQQDANKFVSIEKEYHFNVIFFTNTDQTIWAQKFIQNMMKNPSWKLVYLDEKSIIFLKNNAINQPVIKRFALTENTFHVNSALKKKDIASLMRFAYFLASIGWENAELEVLRQALVTNPNSCPALSQTAFIYMKKDNALMESIFINRMQNVCH